MRSRTREGNLNNMEWCAFFKENQRLEGEAA